MLNPIAPFAAAALAAVLIAPSSKADILVELDATSLPLGNRASWSNTGTVGGTFNAEVDTPVVQNVSGVHAITFDGNNDWYVGPAAPSSVTGDNSRSIEAWVFNPTIDDEETVFAWGRRGGGDGTNLSFNHGGHPTFGAVGHWGGDGDVGWSGEQESNIWSHITYTYDADENRTSVYTNGELSTEENHGIPMDTHPTDTAGQPLPFVIGNQNENNGTRSNPLSASMSIAKIRVYDEVLSQPEVAARYNADASAFGRTGVASPPLIESFTASPPTIFNGNSTTLSWDVTGATSLTIDNSAPAITPADTSVSVSPSATTTYTLTATNADGAVQATTIVTVDPGAPTAADQTVDVDQNSSANITLSATDPNTNLALLAYTVTSPPDNGSLDGTPPNLTYTPSPDYAGPDSFTFTATDGLNTSPPATVTINVVPPPVAPNAIALSALEVSQHSLPGTVVAILSTTDFNPDDTHTYSLVPGIGAGHNALFTLNANQLISAHDFATDPVDTTYAVRLRSTDNTGLSLEQTFTLTRIDDPLNVVINEINHDSPDNSIRSDFVELHNPAAGAIDISGWTFGGGISYTFPANTSIAPGGYLVVAKSPATIDNLFGFIPFGPYSGELSSTADRVILRDALGNKIDEVDYKAEFPWPIAASGDGPSMELLNPLLDNDLGSSWRSSTTSPGQTFITAADTAWRIRKGNSEASSPRTDWRTLTFSEDGTWFTGQTPVGYGDDDDNTLLNDMRFGYTTAYLRKTFNIDGALPGQVRLRLYLDDGAVVWINGHEVRRVNVADGQDAHDIIATDPAIEPTWFEFTLSAAEAHLVPGQNIIAAMVVNQSIGSSDVSFDLELASPSADDTAPETLPSPGSQNSVYTTNPAPNIRQVDHTPQTPTSTAPTLITAKITDPQGVADVTLHLQLVEPGDFIPARTPRSTTDLLRNPQAENPENPEFENPANWSSLPMLDDGTGGDETAGDNIYTARVDAQPNRTLVRYRITVEDLAGASARAPFPDDPSLNFAYFVYDGVPDYVATSRSVHPDGAGHVWPSSLLTELPVYHWIIRDADMDALMAYSGSFQLPNDGSTNTLAARRVYNSEGAFVYDGIVYDHVTARLRGGNSRFQGGGKRHFKFRFNDGHHFQARDQDGKKYPRKWRTFNTHRLFGNIGGVAWGLPESVGGKLWDLLDVPVQRSHYFHFRVIDNSNETSQYGGDFWGLNFAQERYDVRFLDAHDLPKGNLYKLSDWIFDADRQRRYQAPDMVNDGSEFRNIFRNLHPGQDAAWLQEHVDYDLYYRYSAVTEAIRHYDLFPYTSNTRHGLKNWVWHFVPTQQNPTTGQLHTYPYDFDASWGPNWNNGWDHATNALYGHDRSTSGGAYIPKPDMVIEHKNVIREFRDLVWQPDQISTIIDHYADIISTFAEADRDRWTNAPSSEGRQNDAPVSTKVRDMMNFAFVGGSWPGGNAPANPDARDSGVSGRQGRDAYLDAFVRDNSIPNTPTITYTGAAGFPTDGLSFRSSNYSDPQGSGSFASMQWRIGEIEDPAAPAFDPVEPPKFEITASYESGSLATLNRDHAVPTGALKVGRTYRARVRMQDNTGRWSHWSAPVEFTTSEPVVLPALQANLMVTEIMYHPVQGDAEYIELQNISSSQTLDLTGVRFTKGIDFDFPADTTLAPGAYILVVKNLALFESLYGATLPVAGEWDPADSLSNGGERLKLSHGSGTPVRDFTYDDAGEWPTAPDGTGPSLVLDDPSSAPDHTLPTSWRPSFFPQGSPGLPDTSGFSTWLAAVGQTDPDATFPTTTLPNTLTYALGADLVNEPLATLPTITLSAGQPTLTFNQRSTAADATYSVEISTDLDTWTEVPTTEISSTDNGDGTRTIQLRPTSPAPANSFLRLRVTL